MQIARICCLVSPTKWLKTCNTFMGFFRFHQFSTLIMSSANRKFHFFISNPSKRCPFICLFSFLPACISFNLQYKTEYCRDSKYSCVLPHFRNKAINFIIKYTLAPWFSFTHAFYLWRNFPFIPGFPRTLAWVFIRILDFGSIFLSLQKKKSYVFYYYKYGGLTSTGFEF